MDSIPNEAFFQGPSLTEPWPPKKRAPESIPEAVYYGDERPPSEPGMLLRAAARPVVFGVTLFLLGWLGILLQRSFLRQIVVGAPVFEEFAKFGLALILVTMLGARHMGARLPYAWLSGLGFGLFEHFVSYPEEPWSMALLRSAFHAGATGLSMAAYSIVEPWDDQRARWLSTIPSTVGHWANNFGVVLAAIASTIVPIADEVIVGWSALVTLTIVIITLGLLLGEAPVRERARAELARFFPPLGPTPAEGGPRNTAPDLAPPAAGSEEAEAPKGPPPGS